MTRSSPASLVLWSVFLAAGCNNARLIQKEGEPPDPLDSMCQTDADCSGDGSIICVQNSCEDIDTFVCRGSQVPIMEVNPNQVVFSNATFGAAVEETVTVRNVGECLLTLSYVGLDDASDLGFDCEPCDFSVSETRIAPQRSMEITVSYSPVVIGEASATLQLKGDDEVAGVNGLVSVPIYADYDGEPLLEIDPQELNFGYVSFAGDSTTARTETVTISNRGSGNATLTIDYIYAAPVQEFAIPAQWQNITPANPILLPPYDETDESTWLEIPVTFKPSDFDTYESSLTVRAHNGDSAQASDVVVRLSGSSVGPPAISVTPTDIDFLSNTAGPLLIGSSGFQQISIQNAGQSELTVDLGLDDPSSQFSFSPTYLAPIPPGGSAALSVFYDPNLPSDPANPGNPTMSHAAFLRILSNDPGQPLTTVKLDGWAKKSDSDDIVKLEMEYVNGDNGWAGSDYRDVDLEVESPYGFICRKPAYQYAPDGSGGFDIVGETNYCEDWSDAGLQGTARWISAGTYEEPERVVIFGLGQDTADGDVFTVYVHYVEDCSNIPTGLLADLVGIGTSALFGVLGGQLGVPIDVPPDQISDLISENCWDRDPTLATVRVSINGQEVAAPQVSLQQRGSSAIAVRLKREGGQFEVMP